SLAVRLADRLPATRVRLDAELLGRQPEAAPPTLRAALDVLADLEAGDAAPWCVEDREACAKVGRAHAERMQQLRPSRCERVLLQELVAGRAAGAGLHTMALEAYQRLAARHPADARYKKAIAEQKHHIIEQGIGRGGRR